MSGGQNSKKTAEMKTIKIAVFSAQKDDVKYFEAANEARNASAGAAQKGSSQKNVAQKQNTALNFKIDYFNHKLTKRTAKNAAKHDTVCVFTNDSVDKAIIETLKEQKVKLIALRCAGYDNVDLDAAHAQGIAVVNVPAYSPHSVAEHAAALLLALARHICEANNHTKAHNFTLNGLNGFELHGKTVGIIGTGKIGGKFAEICRGFGMKVLAYDKFPAENDGIKYVSLNELFKRSDIISIHCPLFPGTRHLINAESIAKMKDGVVLINTSRGGLVDSEALLAALKSGKVGAAGLDVYENEAGIFARNLTNEKIDDKVLAQLLARENVILTAHQAFLTDEAQKSIAKTTLKNIESFFCRGRSGNEL